MPVTRPNNKRRRSSAQLTGLKSSKLGRYTPSPRVVTFAPNVTPGTFLDCESDEKEDGMELEAKLFPPSEKPSSPSRKRQPKGKRRSQGYIPRPPNAFMLFRADFVRQKHVPGTIETNHTSLSRIIGNCWRSLPLDERKVWDVKAKHAKAEHKAMYPNYRFKPVHNRGKEKKVKSAVAPEDEQRCEEVAQLLLEGMKGEELEEAVKRLDRVRSETPATHRTTADSPAPSLHLSPGPNQPLALPRRPSSVPLPGSFPFPSSFPAPPFAPFGQRQDSLDFGFMDFGRIQMPRRPSSVQPIGSAAWITPNMGYSMMSPHPPSPLPEMNMSLFDPAYLDGPFPASQQSNDGSFNFDTFFNDLPPSTTSSHDLNISPLDNGITNGCYVSPAYNPVPPNHANAPAADSPNWPGSSVPSSIYSGSPAPSDLSLPLHAPRPQRACAPAPPAPEVAPAPAPMHAQTKAAEVDFDLQAYSQGLQDYGIMPGFGMDMPQQQHQHHQHQQFHHQHQDGPVYDFVNSGTGPLDTYAADIFAGVNDFGGAGDYGGSTMGPAAAVAAGVYDFGDGQSREY